MGWPVASNVWDDQFDFGSHDAFLTKLSPDGTSLVFSTLIGEEGDSDYSFAVAVKGETPYIAGTAGPNFPTTPNALDRDWNGDAFVTRFNTDGSALTYSTFLRGYSIGGTII